MNKMDKPILKKVALTILKKLARPIRTIPSSKKTSYSQCGEDIIVDFAFQTLGINNPTYLDIGAHHPSYLSNTFYFYNKNSKGVCVEADPFLNEVIAKNRPRDICLNVGVGTEIDFSNFYIMSTRTLNTFSQIEAERLESTSSQKIENIIEVPMLTVDKIINDNFNSACPNFISLDVEGLDLQILKSMDFQKNRPEVFCVETLTFTEDNTETKITEIIEFLLEKDYFLYADTYINSIFISKEAWEKR